MTLTFFGVELSCRKIRNLTSNYGNALEYIQETKGVIHLKKKNFC